jgi:hypothetical protein
VKRLNDYFLAAKMSFGQDRTTEAEQMLRPTVISGLIVCFRKTIEAGLSSSVEFHKEHLKALSSVPLDQYKSSQWKRLGEAIYNTCYADPTVEERPTTVDGM